MRWPIQIHIELPAFLQRIFERPVEPVVVKSVRLRHLVHSEDGEPDSLIAVLEFNDQDANLFKPQDLRDAFSRGIIDGQNLLNDRPKLEATPEQNEAAYRNDGGVPTPRGGP